MLVASLTEITSSSTITIMFIFKTLEIRLLKAYTSCENISFCVKIILKSLLCLYMVYNKQKNKEERALAILTYIGSATTCLIQLRAWKTMKNCIGKFNFEDFYSLWTSYIYHYNLLMNSIHTKYVEKKRQISNIT